MSPIISIHQLGVSELIQKIIKALDGMSLTTVQQVIESRCDFSYAKKPFDLAKIHWYLAVDHEEFCGPIWGGVAYLEHIPTCSGCLASLNIDVGALSESRKYLHLADDASKILERRLANSRGGN